MAVKALSRGEIKLLLKKESKEGKIKLEID